MPGMTATYADLKANMASLPGAIAHPASLEIRLYSKAKRIRIAEDNPALCAAVFHNLLTVVVEELYSITLHHSNKTNNKLKAAGKGIFGTMKAHYITEPQGRGTLHWH